MEEWGRRQRIRAGGKWDFENFGALLQRLYSAGACIFFS